MVDRCVCCGEIVPEGRQVCPSCERKANCPMTLENIAKYNIKDSFVKKFCSYGCSPICDELLIQHMERRGYRSRAER